MDGCAPPDSGEWEDEGYEYDDYRAGEGGGGAQGDGDGGAEAAGGLELQMRLLELEAELRQTRAQLAHPPRLGQP